MNILIIPANYPNSYHLQKTIFFRDYARALSRQGHKVSVLALVAISIKAVCSQKKLDFGLRGLEQDGVRTWIYQYLYPPKSPSLDRALRYLLTVRLMPKYLEQVGYPNIIHAHGCWPAGEEALWWSRKTNIPFVLTEHSPEYYYPSKRAMRKAMSKVCPKAAERTAVSPGFAEYLQDLSGSFFGTLPNPVDTEFFCPAGRKKDSHRPYTFINIADLKKNKNQAMLIKAFARAYAGNESYRLLIGGSGAEYHRLKSLITELGMEGQIRLLGRLDRNGIRDHLWDSDCFVLSSHKETFGVVLIEAMACGLPVIATNSHGPACILVSPKLGELIDNDLDSLYQALLRVPKVDYDQGFIREYVLRHYALQVIGAKLEKQYLRILKTNST